MICNDIPDCDDIDNAFSKRLRCINYPTEFVNDPTKEIQKKIDININKNFDFWKLDFILLINSRRISVRSRIWSGTKLIPRAKRAATSQQSLYLLFYFIFYKKRENDFMV